MNKKLLIVLAIIAVYRVFTYNNGIKNGSKIRIESRIVREPNIYDDTQRIVLKGISIYLPKYPELNFGDKVVVEGLYQDQKLEDAKLIKIVESEAGIFGFRKKLVDNYQKFLPEPHSAIVAGVVLGSKSLLASEFWEKLKSSGTAHIVVASGTNVTFTIFFLMSILLLFLPRRKAIVVSLVGVWFYVALSGFDAPLVRAAIMGSIAFSAQALGRITQALNSLLLSALVMIIFSPLWVYDAGFILSFAATLSLVLFESRINRLIYFVPNFIRQDLSTTLAAQIGVAPILIFLFGKLSLVAPITNVLVLWTVPIIMILGSIVGLVGLFSIGLGKLLALLVFPLTSWFVYIVNIFS